MAAGDRVFRCRAPFDHNSSEVEGTRYFGFNIDVTKITDPGDAAAPGPAEHQPAYRRIYVTIYGTNYNALAALLDDGAANGVGYTKGPNGANEKVTFKNLHFIEAPQEFTVNAPDAGGMVSMWGVRGECELGDSDTLATMIVWASDS